MTETVFWIIEGILLLVGIPFLYFARPRFPTPFDQFNAAMGDLGRAAAQTAKVMNQVARTMEGVRQ